MSHSPELRQQIEDLALRLVVDDAAAGTPPSAWIPALERIRDSALRGRAEGVAAAAVAILDGIPPDGETSEEEKVSSASALQEGFARLQQALDSERQPQAVHELGLAQDPELLSDFILESREHLAAIEAQVLTIERDPGDSEALNSVFR